jgi:hypothetical protein
LLAGWSHSLAAQAGSAGPVAPAAPADATRDATARSLFEDGVQLAEKAQWDGAEDRFRRAFALRSSPVIAYNLANALAERGKLIEASELLRKLEHDDKLDAGLRQSVTTLQSDITPRIGRVTVNVHGAQKTDVVKLDEAVLLDVQLGVGIPIDPGAHQLVLSRGDKQLDSQSIQITNGGSAEVTLQPLVAPSPSATAAAALSPTDAASASNAAPAASTGSSQPVTKKWWFWTGLGAVGVAAVVVVAVLATGGSSGSGQTQAAYHGDFNPASLQVEVR